MVGFKKMFFPAIEKAKGIIGGDDFGTPRSIYLRYPQGLPPEEQRQDDRCMAGFLDHIVHPASIMIYLMGPVHSLYFLREEWSGGTVASIRFRSGAIGTLHLTAGQSGASPLERVEVIGDGANVVVDNGVHVTYYRKAFRGHYGRTPSYLVSDEQAPLFWEPEFSLGQLYNKNLFMLGYAQEVLHFCECVLGHPARESPPVRRAADHEGVRGVSRRRREKSDPSRGLDATGGHDSTGEVAVSFPWCPRVQTNHATGRSFSSHIDLISQQVLALRA